MLHLSLPGERPALRLRLERAADRLQSGIDLLTEGDGWLPLLHSQEGDGQTLWPGSPPFQDAQQLAHQERTIFATGKTGGGHWSVAIEQDPAGALTWDIACRMHKLPAWLGSTYQAAAQLAICLVNPSQATLQTSGYTFCLSCLPLPEEAACSLACGPARRLVIAPVLSPAPSIPCTVRWRYRLALADAAPTGLESSTA